MAGRDGLVCPGAVGEAERKRKGRAVTGCWMVIETGLGDGRLSEAPDQSGKDGFQDPPLPIGLPPPVLKVFSFHLLFYFLQTLSPQSHPPSFSSSGHLKDPSYPHAFDE